MEDLLIAKNQACFEAELLGRQVREFAGIAPSGEEIHVPFCVVYELANGLITCGRIYFSRRMRSANKPILMEKDHEGHVEFYQANAGAQREPLLYH